MEAGTKEKTNGFKTPEFENRRHKKRLSSIVSGLKNDGIGLLRKEIDLAKLEIKQSVQDKTRNSLWLILGAATGAIGAVFFLATLSLLVKALLIMGGVTDFHAAWMGWGMVSILLLAASVGMVLYGIKALKQSGMKPRSAIQSWKEDGKWIKEKWS